MALIVRNITNKDNVGSPYLLCEGCLDKVANEALGFSPAVVGHTTDYYKCDICHPIASNGRTNYVEGCQFAPGLPYTLPKEYREMTVSESQEMEQWRQNERCPKTSPSDGDGLCEVRRPE